MERPTKKAALYVRVSTEEQGQNYSVPSQLDLTRQHALDAGYEVAGEYIDIGITGTTIARPNLTRLLSDVKAGTVDVVIAKCVDRLARGVRPLSAIMDTIDEADCSLEFVEDSYDGSPISRTLLEIRASIGRMERDLFAQRSHDGRVRKAKEGKVNPPPIPLYGYSYDKGTQKFIVNEDQAEIVRRLFREYAKGTTPAKLAYMLNIEGVATNGRTKYGWSAARISNMLKRTEFYGEGYTNRYRGGPTSHQNQRPREEWIPFEYPAIISRELFDKCMEVRKQNKRWSAVQRATPEYLLAGLLYCTECGMKFASDTEYRVTQRTLPDGTRKRYPKGGPIRYYHCSGTSRYPHIYDCRRPRWLRAEPIDELVWDNVLTALRNPDVLLAGLKAKQQQMEDELSERDSDLKRMETKLSDSALGVQRLMMQLRKGTITEDEFEIQMKLAREEAEHWREERDRLQRMAAQVNETERIRETIAGIARNLEHSTEWDFETRRAVIRELVKKVTIDRPGNITVYMHIREPEVTPTGLSPETS